MRTGSLFEVAVVFKGLSHLARKKALSFRGSGCSIGPSSSW
jgi:hypothetical protein